MDSTKEKIWQVLDQAVTEGRPQPSMRALRAQVGGGSMSTIADAVREWKVRQVAVPDTMPGAFSDAATQAIAKAVWAAASADITKFIADARAADEAVNAATMSTAEQLRATGEELVAEAEAKDAELKTALGQISALQAQLAEATARATQATTELAELKVRYAELDKRCAVALEDAANAKGQLQSLREMMPYLSPKPETAAAK